MAKGLPWVRISAEIAMDGEIELVSDAAFRAYVEIIALSGHYLLDGRVPLRLVRKQCNVKDVDAALAELSAGDHPYLVVDGEDVVIPKYKRWQQTSEQVEAKRRSTLQRVAKHRACNAVTSTVTSTAGNGSRNTITSVQSTEYRVQSTEKREEEGEERDAPSAPRVLANGETDWVSAWVLSERAVGREPSKHHRAAFGRKVRELGAIDPPVMHDAIRRMTEEQKHPGTLPYVYGDCRRQAEGELLRMGTEVRRVR